MLLFEMTERREEKRENKQFVRLNKFRCLSWEANNRKKGTRSQLLHQTKVTPPLASLYNLKKSS